MKFWAVDVPLDVKLTANGASAEAIFLKKIPADSKNTINTALFAKNFKLIFLSQFL
jgi:hypothetical protein